MEILKSSTKPENEIDYIDDFNILSEEKPTNEIEKIDLIKLTSEIDIKE
jgi:hypothetical protein